MNVLAEGVVQFVAQGVEKIDGAVNRIFGILARFTRAGSVAVDRFLASIKRGVTGVRDFATATMKSMSSAASSFTLFGAGAAAAIGAFAAKASSGTVEGERFALSMRRLTLVLGDQLGPYIRQTTAAINQISNSIARVDPATRNWITGLVLATGAVLTAGVTFLKLASTISPLLTVFRILPLVMGLLTPILTGVIGLVISLGSALIAIAGPFLGIGAIIAAVVVGLVALGGAFSSAKGEALTLGGAIGGVYEILADIFSVIYGVGEAIGKELVGAVMALGRVFQSLYTEYAAPALAAIGNALAGLYPVFKPVVDAMMGAWRWFTQNVSFTWKSVVRFIGDVFLGIVVVIGQAINGLYKIFSVSIGSIIELLAYLGEKTRVLSKATADAMRDYSKSLKTKDLIDVDGLVNRMGAASNKIGGMLEGNTADAKKLGQQINDGVGNLKAPTVPEFKLPNVPEFKVPDALMKVAQDQIKKPRDLKGLTPKMDVTFEGLTGTFDRLQKAFATNPGQSVEEAQLKELQVGNALQGQVVQAVQKIQPAVGP